MNKPMNQKTAKNGSSGGGGGSSLTSTEAEVLGLFLSGRNASQIANKRGCSHSYVSRILKKLCEKGMVHPPVQGVGYTHEPHEPKSPEPMNILPSSGEKRVHAQRFTFNIVRAGKRFKDNLSQTFDDGTYVQVSGKRLYVMAGKDRCFSGESLDVALRASLDWWSKRFSRIESDLDCVFWKERKVFEVSYTEVASEDSVVASDVIDRSGHVRVFSHADGKLRLSFDMSKGFPEHEVHHKKSWRRDDEAFSRQMNALLDYGVDGATLPELARLHAELAETLRSQMEVVTTVVKSLERPSGPVDDGKNLKVVDYFG